MSGPVPGWAIDHAETPRLSNASLSTHFRGQAVEELVVRVGHPERECLTLTIRGRWVPESGDYWDDNWLGCTATVSAGAFHGSHDGCVCREDFTDFRAKVAKLHARLTGEAAFDTMEDWLSLRLVGTGRGHVEAHGELRDDTGGGVPGGRSAGLGRCLWTPQLCFNARGGMINC